MTCKVTATVTDHNCHKPKRPQPKAINRNDHKTRRPQTERPQNGTATNRNGHKPEWTQTETASNLNGHNPKRSHQLDSGSGTLKETQRVKPYEQSRIYIYSIRQKYNVHTKYTWINPIKNAEVWSHNWIFGLNEMWPVHPHCRRWPEKGIFAIANLRYNNSKPKLIAQVFIYTMLIKTNYQKHGVIRYSHAHCLSYRVHVV